MGVSVSLFRSKSTELWMNVTNEGKSPVKRMRARLKFYPIPKPPTKRPKPEGMSDEDWEKSIEVSEQFKAKIQREVAESQFGRPLPFSRTPKGTIGRPWIEADNRVTYEVDLSPKSDEASAEIIALYPLDEVALMELEKSKVIGFPHAEGSPFPNARVTAILIGNTSGFVINPTGEGMLYDLALKFWILGENLVDEVSEIYHVEVPNSLNGIVCTKLKKGSKEYKAFEKLLAA
jgi:hypothetical protein